MCFDKTINLKSQAINCKILVKKVWLDKREFFMSGEESASHYEIVFKKSGFGILGENRRTGEKICFENLYFDKNTAEEIVFILNKNKVSRCHAKDVIRDKILENFI